MAGSFLLDIYNAIMGNPVVYSSFSFFILILGLVLNSDAMGKSMQGAGGVLVMGSVFRSLVTRTQQYPEFQNKYPEAWLKDCYNELQSVFVSFDGSMLVSLVVGLLSESQGAFYYINAEHPMVALYRDGNAGFIEEESNLRKIGVPYMKGELQIRTFQLLRGTF